MPCCNISLLLYVFFFKQKTAYEIGTGDWSSDVCSSDLSLAEDQTPPDKLKRVVANMDLVLSSVRPRAIETATWATDGREPQPHAVFNEAPLPPPRDRKSVV